MKKIAQFPLREINVDKVEMPEGADIVLLQAVDGIPYLFALIDVDQKRNVIRTFYRYKTGAPVPDSVSGQSYVGSYYVQSFGFVFHIFEDIVLAVLKPESVPAIRIVVPQQPYRVQKQEVVEQEALLPSDLEG